MGYHNTGSPLDLETPEAGNSPAITSDLQKLANQINERVAGGFAAYKEGTAASRPAAGVKGRIYYATDTHVYSFDTGSEWRETCGAWHSLTYATNIEAGSFQTPGVRVENFGAMARLRGSLKVPSGHEIASYGEVGELPSGVAIPPVDVQMSVAVSLTGAHHRYDVRLGILTTGVLYIQIPESESLPGESQINLDGVTYNLT